MYGVITKIFTYAGIRMLSIWWFLSLDLSLQILMLIFLVTILTHFLLIFFTAIFFFPSWETNDVFRAQCLLHLAYIEVLQKWEVCYVVASRNMNLIFNISFILFGLDDLWFNVRRISSIFWVFFLIILCIWNTPKFGVTKILSITTRIYLASRLWYRILLLMRYLNLN